MNRFKQYYELHITMEGEKETIQGMVEDSSMPQGWKFSAIDGDPILGKGVKCYATKHVKEGGDFEVMFEVTTAAQLLSNMGAKVIRKKVELVIFDVQENVG